MGEHRVPEGRRRADEPIRLFDSDVLEFFTHIHPAVVVALWLPVGAFFLVRAALDPRLGPIGLAVGAIAGLGIWTLAEYTLHRFVFHFRPRTPRQERLAIGHRDAHRLVTHDVE